jgi:putative membrane protein
VSSPLEQNGRETVIPMRRLHPLSPVLRGLRLFALAVAALSWRTLQDLHLIRWLILVAVLFVGLLAYAAVAWRFTGFEVIGRELRVHDGLLSRRVRTVPLERLQAIEVVQPALARVFGLAELKLDVAGSQKSEAPLSFLPLPEAVTLRERLLGLAGGVAATASKVDETEILLHRVDNGDVAVSQFLTPPVMLTPLAVLYIVGQVVLNEDFGLFAILSMITAVAATIGRPIMRTLNYWHFRIARGEDGRLRLRHGLVTKRSQVIPTHRIQSLTVTWPLLWRVKGWMRVTLAVAGQSSSGEDRGRTETDRLLPVADLATARAVLPYVVPGVDPGAMPLTRVPAGAGWIAPFRARILAAGLAETVFAAVDGFATRTLTVVPYGRIQSVRITQGPWQRALGLASVHADVANSSPVTAAHRPVGEAYAWVDELARRALAARTQSGPGSTRQE